MQNNGVKTLSIIDTISELAQNENLQLAAQVHSPGQKSKVGSNGHFKFLTSSPKKSSSLPSFKVRESHSVKEQTFVSRGQTPEWIREIFAYVKKGQRDKLKSSLSGLEYKLIRNITDHVGNNLLHTVCQNGQTHLLPLLAEKFGSNEYMGALSDVNQRGLTPPMLAIKNGYLECVKWIFLASNSPLIPLHGRTDINNENGFSELPKISILHLAAKYGQNEIVSWCCDEMLGKTQDVNQIDSSGNSPLHISAKYGRLSTLSTLLAHGANISSKNDMGLKAVDCARYNNKKDCEEYLFLYEASLGISQEYLNCSFYRETCFAHLTELKGHFKETLSVSKRLLKERLEYSKEFSRICESLSELQGCLLSQNSNLSECNSKIDDVIVSLEQKRRQLFSAKHFVDFETRVLKAEEGWIKMNKEGICDSFEYSSSSHPNTSDSFSQDSLRHLRNKLEKYKSLAFSFVNLRERSRFSENEDEEEDNRGVRSMNGIGSDEDDMSQFSSNLSNEMYSKIGSPTGPPEKFEPISSTEEKKEKKKKKPSNAPLLLESASVIEVLEPTFSEEEDFKKSLHELNISLSSFKKELSPTKKLMEMGISASSFASPNVTDYILTNNTKTSGKRNKTNLFKKVKERTEKKEKKSTSSSEVEEHVLPDSFDDEFGDKSKSKSKAWYELASEEETETPEADSLALLISHRSSSDEDDENDDDGNDNDVRII